MIMARTKAASRATPTPGGQAEKIKTAGQEAPPRSRSSDKSYLKKLGKLQVDLVKAQDWIVQKRLKVLVLFEGRDAAV